MSSDRLSTHWLSNTAASTGGSGANAGRQQQQPSSASSSPPPLRATSAAAFTGACRDESRVPVSASPAHVGGTPKYGGPTTRSMAASTVTTTGTPTGYQSMGNAAPYNQPHAGGRYQPSRQQSSQQWAYANAPFSLNIPLHSHPNSNRVVSGTMPAYTVNVPVGVGSSGGEGQTASGHIHWRGGGDEHQRRRSERGRSSGRGGHGDPCQGPRRQRQQQQPSSRSQHGRIRGGRGGSYSNSDTAMHSRISSLSSGPELQPPPPIDSGGSTNAECEEGYGTSDRPSTSPSNAAAATAPLVSSDLAGGAGALGAGGEARTDRPPAATASPRPSALSTQQQQQPQQQSAISSAGMSRSGASASSIATNANTAAAAGGTRYTRPRGEERPTVVLSQHIMSVYQTINEIFYQERQKLLAAPAKYAARKNKDTSGHYVPCEGEVIADRYVFKELIGQGSFGKVLHCVDRKYNEPVAVKVIRSGTYFEGQGWFEAQVVAHLNNDPSLQNLVVQLRKVFLWKGHMVLVFEPLSFSLYKLITLTKHNGVSLDLTRKFAYQMVKVLLVLEQHQPPIIHCDLKPENVLLRDPSRSGVRVIDFGSACYQQQATWRLPPAQVPLPASSPSASAGSPWGAVDERRGGGASTAAAVSGSSPITSPRAQTAAAASSFTDRALAGSSGDALPGGTTNAPPPTTTTAAAAAVAATNAVANTTEGAFPAVTAHEDVEVLMPKYIQSRYYRSPEVILELGYTTAIDRWSLGCFLTEMHTGHPLFQGNNEADMMAYFTMVLGPLPDYMIASSPKRTRLYRTCPVDSGAGEGSTSTPPPSMAPSAASVAEILLLQHQRAASPLLTFTASPSPALHPFSEAPGHAPGSPFFLRTPQVEDKGSATAYAARAEGPGNPLEKVLGVRTGGPRGCRAGQRGHDEVAYETFCDFIGKLLQYDPRKRMSCSQAMLHPFLEPIRVLEACAAAAAGGASPTSPRTDSSAPAGAENAPATVAGPTAAAASTASTAAAAAPDKSVNA